MPATSSRRTGRRRTTAAPPDPAVIVHYPDVEYRTETTQQPDGTLESVPQWRARCSCSWEGHWTSVPDRCNAELDRHAQPGQVAWALDD